MSNIDQSSSELAHERERRPEIIHESLNEHHDRLREHHGHKHPEQHERNKEKNAAYSEALEIAPSTEEVKHPHREQSPAERRRGPLTKKQLDEKFNETMGHVQTEMSSRERTFSKFIHTPVIERTSEFLGATIARPNALLAGSIGAFGLTLAIYLFAKSVGYPLSGFEPIAAFVLGWVIGLMYDYLRVMVTGKR